MWKDNFCTNKIKYSVYKRNFVVNLKKSLFFFVKNTQKPKICRFSFQDLWVSRIMWMFRDCVPPICVFTFFCLNCKNSYVSDYENLHLLVNVRLFGVSIFCCKSVDNYTIIHQFAANLFVLGIMKNFMCTKSPRELTHSDIERFYFIAMASFFSPLPSIGSQRLFVP